jgi:hypothetical protein
VRYPRPLQIGARRPFARPGTLRTPAHWCTNGAPFTHRRVSALPPARTHCTASSAHRPCTQLTRLGEPELASAASVASRPLPNGAPIAPPCTSSLTSYALLCPATPRRGGVITFDAGLVISAVTLGEGLAVLKSTPSDERAASASAPHRGDVWCMLCTVCLRGLSACHLWRGGKGASPRPASGFGRRFLVHPRARPWPTIGAPRRSRRLRRPRRLRLHQQPRVWWGAVAEPAGCSMRAQMAGEYAAAFGGAASMLCKRAFDAVACRAIARSIVGGASDGRNLQVRAGCLIAAHSDTQRLRIGSKRVRLAWGW